MRTYCLQLLLLVNASLLACQLYANPLSQNDTINNGALTEFVQWYDTDGNVINAHDGGMIVVNGIYYWYGLALRPLGQAKDENNGAATTTGINLYSSKNLTTWKYEGVILPVSKEASSPLRAPMRLERPKMLYNKKTKKFVLWFHYVGYPGTHGQKIGLADAGVAVADNIKGPFTFLGINRPINDSGAVKDCTLFLDNDSTAYFVYDRKLEDGSRCLHLVKLSADFLQPTNEWKKIEVANRREAPVLIKRNGVYYLITSDVSGWKANAAKTFKATNIMGPWTDVGNPCTGEGMEATYNTQGTHAFQLINQPNTTILMLERHNTDNFLKCSYVWLPIEYTKDNNPSIPYKSKWVLPKK